MQAELVGPAFLCLADISSARHGRADGARTEGGPALIGYRPLATVLAPLAGHYSTFARCSSQQLFRTLFPVRSRLQHSSSWERKCRPNSSSSGHCSKKNGGSLQAAFSFR